MSQWGDWNAQWELYYLLGRACDEFGDISFQNPGDPFGLPNDPEDESEKVLVTNAYKLKLTGKEADLFRALIDLLETTDSCDFPDWLAKLAKLEIVESSCTPVQKMVESLLQQAVMLNIPRVIPLGKSENEMAKEKAG